MSLLKAAGAFAITLLIVAFNETTSLEPPILFLALYLVLDRPDNPERKEKDEDQS